MVQLIVVAPEPKNGKPGAYHARLQSRPGCFGTGTSPSAAVGNLIRFNFEVLGLCDRELEARMGEQRDEMTDSGLGQLAQRRKLFAIKEERGLSTR